MNLTGEVALMFLVAIGPLAFATWCWVGRSRAARWWVGNPLNERMVRAVLPGWGLMGAPVVLMAMFEFTRFETRVDAVGLWLVWPGILITAWGVLFVPIPRWWAPRWHRRLSDEERQPNLREPLTALMVGFTGDSDVRSHEDAARVFAGSRRLGSWRGGYVYDPDATRRPHALAQRGTIGGDLTAYEAGLVFSAWKLEDNLRGQPTVLAIEAEQITGVRVVPPRAGADGVKRKGLLFKSAFPRLVIDTTQGSHVFDFVKSRQIAEQLQALVTARK